MIVLGAAIYMVAAQAGPLAATAPDRESGTIVPPNAELATRRARTLDKKDVDAWLDGLMPYALHRGDIAGAVVVVVKDGQPLTARGFGYADVANRKPVEPARTLFRPGSISKLMTWTAVMQLVEQGKLDLDADVNRYLDFRIPPYQGKPLTLRNLMHHTTGFDDSARKLIQIGEVTPEPLGQVLREALPKRILPPGDISAYSNYGVGLAGYIVERASRMPFEDYVERHIFAPLDMDRSTFRYPLPAQLRPDMSKGYALGSGAALPYEVVQLTPAGSMATTGTDIGKFMIGYLSRSGALIKPASAALMYDTTNDMLPRGNRMALGFFAEDRNGHRVRSHAGDTMLFHSHVWLFIDDDVGVFLSLNSAGKDDAAAAIRTMFLKEFADRYFPGDIAASYRKPLPEQARSDARLMAGQYWTSWRSDTSFLRIYSLFDQITVTATDGGIGLTPDREPGWRPARVDRDRTATVACQRYGQSTRSARRRWEGGTFRDPALRQLRACAVVSLGPVADPGGAAGAAGYHPCRSELVAATDHLPLAGLQGRCVGRARLGASRDASNRSRCPAGYGQLVLRHDRGAGRPVGAQRRDGRAADRAAGDHRNRDVRSCRSRRLGFRVRLGGERLAWPVRFTAAAGRRGDNPLHLRRVPLGPRQSALLTSAFSAHNGVLAAQLAAMFGR
ncbi:CubicO group peptidase (beta-lactamase class C family) [Sphingosinicella microcystinivorans]|uniref:CubicO group peptidase (Beta-lactamase class C family) n=2 Tax=Sphingosinicella microcystinivorans TaxID=335406 RepID=A0ABX9T1K2_SPHMI|nr:CubicO group peptidase (beta-lactamase class C family) [Sphingosinicella microcystinivorans]